MSYETESRQEDEELTRLAEADCPTTTDALRNLVAMVEENGPDYADSDAMKDARYALGVGLHEAIELGAEGYRFDAKTPEGS